MKSLVIGNQENKELFKKIRLYFIGTSYAPDGKGKETVMPIAEKFGVQDQVIEYTNRIPYFEALKLLKDANMLIVPGSDDPNYTASKLYNYIISRKPIITVFNEGSSVNTILQSIGYKNIVTFNKTEHLDKTTMILHKAWLEILMTLPYEQEINQDVFERYTAKLLTKQQTKHFERCLNLL